MHHLKDKTQNWSTGGKFTEYTLMFPKSKNGFMGNSGETLLALRCSKSLEDNLSLGLENKTDEMVVNYHTLTCRVNPEFIP